MSAGHTPAPWFAVNQGTREEPMMSVMAALSSGKPPLREVAYCGTGEFYQEMENANARLIAAAPDLLAACIQARGALRLDAMHDDDGKPYGTTSVAMEAIDAAIARAEGKAP